MGSFAAVFLEPAPRGMPGTPWEFESDLMQTETQPDVLCPLGTGGSRPFGFASPLGADQLSRVHLGDEGPLNEATGPADWRLGRRARTFHQASSIGSNLISRGRCV